MKKIIFANYIDGEWVKGETFENRNPANIDEIVSVHVKGKPADIIAAVDAANRAFPAWANLSASARGKYLFKVADILEKQLDSLAEEMTREEGKTLQESRGEIMRSIDIFRYYGSEGSRLFGFQVPSNRARVHTFSIRKPLGVVGLITPWNFPSAIPAWKMAPALICGNTIVIKPASPAPLSSWRLIEAFHKAEIPKGVVNYVAGPGDLLGRSLINAESIKAISFTGSEKVGNLIYNEASKQRLKIQLEMGGKNPTVVLNDCDLDAAVENVINAAFFSSGQKCTATSRVIVEQEIYEKFLTSLVKRTKDLKVGNGLKKGIDVGPVINQNQLDANLHYIEIGSKEAGDAIVGGYRLQGEHYDRGYFIAPTIFAGVKSGMNIAQEEIFGPVLSIMKAKNFEDALYIANDIHYGLCASIQTKNISRAFEFISKAEVGLVTVNLPSAGVEYQLPFGGTKDSSFGPKEQGPAALDFYSDYKTVYIKY